MSQNFDKDDYPGRPKVLFVGLGDSTHTHAWIDLLRDKSFNVRLFCTSPGVPPDDWPVRTYVTAYEHGQLNSSSRAVLHSSNQLLRFTKRNIARAGRVNLPQMADRWLAEIIRTWRPDIIHTLGLESAGEYFFHLRRRFGLEQIGKWVLQLRGGSDLALSHLDPNRQHSLAEMLRGCDQLLSDNQQNFRIAQELGVRADQLSRIGTVPGTGGIDIDALASRWPSPPSRRRIILWPKVYECAWSKVLPTYEALKLCWDRLQPCELHLLAMTDEARMYFWTLPEQIRRGCRLLNRVPRSEAIAEMTGARLMLAPSLVDGTPNSMFEAMASGAVPIVSPIETISAIVENERNVLFARNLYPEEIASALVRGMTDDALVDDIAQRNLGLVRRLADRHEVQPRVVNFYESLAAEPLGQRAPATS
jgi:glycosyltransferase involved in cell wall biosynthesis